ncbi:MULTISPECIES: hypothetical protein [unclassified Mesorhizobium]|uniref:hypothetical protein n=1 Tax=unclassified Mesorhizobium TaxID=325217 RepID=UPI00301584E8
MARPKLGNSETERLHVKITADEIRAIDDWRYANRVPSRSEAVRRLVQMGLSLDYFAGSQVANLSPLLELVDEKPRSPSSEDLNRLRAFLTDALVTISRARRYAMDPRIETMLERDATLKKLAIEGEQDE